VAAPAHARGAGTAPGTGPDLVTVGHGTLVPDRLAGLLGAAGVGSLVDVRSSPGSRRNPAFGRAELERWLPEHGVAYRWEPRLGGLRPAPPVSPDTALREPAFRGYAEHMRSAEFGAALGALMEEVARHRAAPAGGMVCVMCAESAWWRCHRRLLADAVTAVAGGDVGHLMHDGLVVPHSLTGGARLGDDGLLVYDAGAAPML
jgi:uncharacterized protein (DUF488 family)